jgi:hypothetical protein
VYVILVMLSLSHFFMFLQFVVSLSLSQSYSRQRCKNSRVSSLHSSFFVLYHSPLLTLSGRRSDSARHSRISRFSSESD